MPSTLIYYSIFSTLSLFVLLYLLIKSNLRNVKEANFSDDKGITIIKQKKGRTKQYSFEIVLKYWQFFASTFFSLLLGFFLTPLISAPLCLLNSQEVEFSGRFKNLPSSQVTVSVKGESTTKIDSSGNFTLFLKIFIWKSDLCESCDKNKIMIVSWNGKFAKYTIPPLSNERQNPPDIDFKSLKFQTKK